MAVEEEIYKKLGQTIAKKRKAAGYTQDQVSEHLSIGSEAFSRIERGVNGVSVEKLYALAELFGCGVETFFVESSRRNTDQAEHINRMLVGLGAADRQLILQMTEKLAARLKRSS